MGRFTSITRAEALAEIADSPATVEFRHLAEAAELVGLRSGNGLLVADTDGRMVGAMGSVLADDVQELLVQKPRECELVVDVAAYEQLQGAYRFERAIIQTLNGPWRHPDYLIDGLTIRPMTAADSLDHVPDELREELEYARPRTRILAGLMDAVPVGFAYVVASSGHADMSIDTLDEYRQRGIATAVAAAMVDAVVAAGKTPVWGAVESNQASLRLAAKLGFRRPAGTLYVAEEPLA
jgi:GNAT superfamily N-acetyltransferase